MRIVAIVLAAGLSSRFGEENKLLHKIEGRPMISIVVDEVRNSKIDKIVVVSGKDHEEIRELFSSIPKVKVLENIDYALGMSTSISKGVSSLGKDIDACMICLGDMPFLTCEDYDLIISSYSEETEDPQIVVPIYNSQKGHPVVFDRHFFKSLKSLPVADTGASEVVSKNAQHLQFVQMDHDHILEDIDFKPSEK